MSSNHKLMNSGYARIADDDYKTIDPRCTYGFLQHFKPKGTIVDVCAPSGSGIVDTLKKLGFNALPIGNAWADFRAEWVVTNPPYKRPLVDEILWRQIERVMVGDVYGFATLMRWGFDYAAEREEMFAKNLFYFGQIKLLFRPRWIDSAKVKAEGKKEYQPFHPFVWHVWTHDNVGQPLALYATGEKPNGTNGTH
jgi:hypothetical protein